MGAKAKSTSFQGPYTREDGFLGYNEICEEQSKHGNTVAGEEDQDDKVLEIKDLFKVREKLASKKFVKRGTKWKIVGVLFAIPGTLQLQKKV